MYTCTHSSYLATRVVYVPSTVMGVLDVKLYRQFLPCHRSSACAITVLGVLDLNLY